MKYLLQMGVVLTISVGLVALAAIHNKSISLGDRIANTAQCANCHSRGDKECYVLDRTHGQLPIRCELVRADPGAF